MKKVMVSGKWLKLFIVGISITVFGIFWGCEPVSAKYSSYSACISASGGRGDIASVQWACHAEQSNGANSCSLWIGGNDSKSTTITVETNKTSGSLNIKFWGMCTQSASKTKNIWVYDDNGSINDSSNLNRGKWAHPTSKGTTLNIAKFISGSGVEESDVKVGGKVYTQYKRKVTIKRQNAGAASCSSYSTACSSMKETIRLRILKGGNLTVQEKNIYDNSNIKKWSAGYDADWKKVQRDYKGNDSSPKKFIGWKVSSDHAVKGTTYIIERTSRKVNGKEYGSYLDSSSISDSDVVYYKNNSAKRIYSKLNVNMANGDRTVWAYYAPTCKLTISQASNTTITVQRTGGSYGIRRNLSNNSNIFRGDKLKISATKNSGAAGKMTLYLKSSTTSKKTWNSGSTYTVSGKDGSKCENVTVSTTLSTTPPSQDPDPETSEETELKLEQKNARIEDEYGTEAVFAKPDDTINYKATYYAGAQSAHGEVRQLVRVGGQLLDNPNNLSIGRVWTSWGNGFCVSDLWDRCYDYSKGLVATSYETGSYIVKGEDVGHSMIEEAKTSDSNTPKKVEFGKETVEEEVSGSGGSLEIDYGSENVDAVEVKIDGSVIAESCYNGDSGHLSVKSSCISSYSASNHTVSIKYETNSGSRITKTYTIDFRTGLSGKQKKMVEKTVAKIDLTNVGNQVETRVPYNFETGSEIDDDGKEEVVFAGEEKLVSGKIYLKGRDNSVTNAFYVTKADDVLKRIIVYRTSDSTAKDGGRMDGDRTANVCSGYFGITNCTETADNTDNTLRPSGNASSVITGSSDYIWYKGSGGTIDISYGNPDAARVTDAKQVLIDGNVVADICWHDDWGTAVISSECLNILSSGTHSLVLITESEERECNLSTYEGCGRRTNTLMVVESSSGASRNYSFMVPDYDAGVYVCVALAVFPADSGEDDNISTSGYTKAWRVSNSKCFKIAKKPSLQVWGGNVYAAGSITTAVARKKVTAYYSGEHSFGSWGEMGVIAGGRVTGFGSGASLGYALNNGDKVWPYYNPAPSVGNNDSTSLGGPGGSTKFDYCMWSVLTFANEFCPGSAGNLSGMSGNAIADKGSVIDKMFSGDDTNNECLIEVSDINQADCFYSGNDMEVGGAVIESDGGGEPVGLDIDDDDDDEELYYSDDEDGGEEWSDENDDAGDEIEEGQASSGEDEEIASVGTLELEGDIKRIHSRGTITISGDLVYSDKKYESLSQIPKLVIYAEHDIDISCNVEEIDALLIAGGTVRTCANSDNINSARNSKQLKIVGAVIANKLEPRRTYGAATGANSIVPAEIINFDPSLYLWNKPVNNVAEEIVTGGLEPSFVVEVSPRL